VVQRRVLAVADRQVVQSDHSVTCMLAHHTPNHSSATTGNTASTRIPAGQASGLLGIWGVLELGRGIQSSIKLEHHSQLQK
jgi:hypothetical protein